MRLILAGLFVVIAGSANGQTCTQFANATSCSNGLTATGTGSQLTWSDGVSATGSGKSINWSDGTTANRQGNTTVYSSGLSSRTSGNITTFSDGRICTRFANTLSCTGGKEHSARTTNLILRTMLAANSKADRTPPAAPQKEKLPLEKRLPPSVLLPMIEGTKPKQSP